MRCSVQCAQSCGTADAPATGASADAARPTPAADGRAVADAAKKRLADAAVEAHSQPVRSARPLLVSVRKVVHLGGAQWASSAGEGVEAKGGDVEESERTFPKSALVLGFLN